jgi:exonuclease III
VIIVLNVQAPTEDKIDMKDSFYEELECVFNNFPKYHTKILLGDFNAKIGREDIFKPTLGNKGLHEISNDNGGRLVTSDQTNMGHDKITTKRPLTFSAGYISIK